MIPCLQLPFQFDLQLLKRDLTQIHPEEWTPHYNERDFGGDWSGVALRSLTGNSSHLHAKDTAADAYADTDVLLRCPYFREVLSAFACPLKSARLLRLAPGSVIREHTDPALGFEEGEARIHIPIRTNAEVEFWLAGERLQLDEGNCFYINVSLPHRVSNHGNEDRIHLVIDTEVNDWLREVFRKSSPVGISMARPNGVEGFRQAVLADGSLQRRLYAVEDHGPFRHVAAGLARELGFNVEHHDMEPVRWIAAGANRGADWCPVEFRLQAGQPFAEWVYFGSRRFVEPFFEDTVRAALRNPFARAFRHHGPLGGKPGMTPSGFIFHMSRCGSTLMAQMLASIPRVLMISEAGPIDAAIQTNNADWVRQTVQALGQQRFGESHYFIKLDSWHIHNLPLLRKAFPGTPWIFVYRNPVEVLVSQLRCPGKQALPGAMDPEALGLSFSDITAVEREEWCARVLAGFCRSALTFGDDPDGLFVDYRQLPDAAWGSVSKHFSLDLSAAERDRMDIAAKVDAKSPGRSFESDSNGKQRAATDVVHGLAAHWLNPLYSGLQTVTRHA